MKRKLLALLTVLLLLAAMATPAFADVLWMPRENVSYDYDEVLNRAFLANGGDGYVTVYTAPDSMSKVTNLANGTRFYVVYTREDKDGSLWGLGYEAVIDGAEGWVPLADMALIYDYISFEEDHSHEFQKYDGSGDHLTEAFSYSYPGGVRISNVKGMEGGAYTLAEGFQNLYTDENGLRWSYIGYYYGLKNFWICIDDPMNENLGVETYLTVDQVRNAPDAELTPAVADVPDTSAVPLWVIPVALVIVVAVVTAVIIRKRRKDA